MGRRVFRYFLIFILAAAVGYFAGAGGAYLFHASNYIIPGLIGSQITVFILWLISFRQLDKIISWLSNAAVSTQILSLPQSGVWGELTRFLTRTLRHRDKQIEQAQQQINNLFAALEVAPIGILLLDKDRHVIWGNHNAALYFSLSFPRDYRQPVTNLVRYPEFVEYLYHLDSGHSPNPLKLAVAATLKRTLLVQMITDPSSFYHLLLVQDHTKQEQINQIRQDFVANVSHEIRTPLTVLIGFIETLQQLPLNEEERKHYLNLMAQQSSRIHHLVNDLLTLAKLESSSTQKLNAWVNIRNVMSQVACMASETSAGRHTIHFSEPSIEGQVDVAGDSNEIFSAMSNLVNNAIRYTPAGGTIDISWQLKNNGEFLFSVSDNGPGIAQEHIARITERFYRIDQSRSQQTGGTGLGLSIVKHIMQRHNGTLEIHSKLGEGATFALHFPKTRVTPIEHDESEKTLFH